MTRSRSVSRVVCMLLMHYWYTQTIGLICKDAQSKHELAADNFGMFLAHDLHNYLRQQLTTYIKSL